MDAETPRPLVHIIDDDTGLCEALVRLVRSVGLEGRAYNSVQGFLAAPPENVPSCILLDVRLPDMSSLDLQDSLVRRGLPLPVVMMTGYGDIPMSVRAMKAGAVDFLPKPFRDQDLLDAVERALARDRKQIGIRVEQEQLNAKFAALTLREQEVFQGIMDGLMNREIAERLSLSLATVKAHRGALTRKMGVANAADLVRFGRLLDLVRD